jgi:hypothetical protein
VYNSNLENKKESKIMINENKIQILENFTKICNVLYENNRFSEIELIENLVNTLDLFDFVFEYESIQDYESNMNQFRM